MLMFLIVTDSDSMEVSSDGTSSEQSNVNFEKSQEPLSYCDVEILSNENFNFGDTSMNLDITTADSTRSEEPPYHKTTPKSGKILNCFCHSN